MPNVIFPYGRRERVESLIATHTTLETAHIGSPQVRSVVNFQYPISHMPWNMQLTITKLKCCLRFPVWGEIMSVSSAPSLVRRESSIKIVITRPPLLTPQSSRSAAISRKFLFLGIASCLIGIAAVLTQVCRLCNRGQILCSIDARYTYFHDLGI